MLPIQNKKKPNTGTASWELVLTLRHSRPTRSTIQLPVPQKHGSVICDDPTDSLDLGLQTYKVKRMSLKLILITDIELWRRKEPFEI